MPQLFLQRTFFTLDLTRCPPSQSLIWSQKTRTKGKVHSYASCFTLFLSVSTLSGISRWAAAQEKGSCDFVALAEVLGEQFTDDLTAPVLPLQCNNEHQAALHAHTAMTCKNTPPFKEQDKRMWLARIFSSLRLLGANAEKPHNWRRGRGKKYRIPNPRRGCCLGKLFPEYTEFTPGCLGAFTLKNSRARHLHSRLPSHSFSIHLRHKHIYSFIQNLLTFQ